MGMLKALVALALLQLSTAGRVPCYSGVKIFLPPPHGITTPGLQQTLANNVTAAIPGSFLRVVPYNTMANFSVGVANGQNLIKTEIRNYLKSCPNSPVVLMGYSEGGIVVMNALCGDLSGQGQIKPYWAKNIVAAISYGEETYVSGQSYDQGTCTSGQGENPRTNSTSCNIYGSVIQSYCDAPDPYCCGGNDPNSHFEYANAYDLIATQFVVNQYNAFRQKQH